MALETYHKEEQPCALLPLCKSTRLDLHSAGARFETLLTDFHFKFPLCRLANAGMLSRLD
jgi:hypothetical protein